MGRLVHTGLGSSSLIAHVIHLPPFHKHANSFVVSTAVINTHSLGDSEATETHFLFTLKVTVTVTSRVSVANSDSDSERCQ